VVRSHTEARNGNIEAETEGDQYCVLGDAAEGTRECKAKAYEKLVVEAETLMEVGDHLAASQAYISLVGMEVESSDLWFKLGQTLERTGNETGALEAFKRTSELRPKDATALLMLARLQRMSAEETKQITKNLRKSIILFGGTVEFDNESLNKWSSMNVGADHSLLQAYRTLGLVLLDMGQYKKAILYLRKALNTKDKKGLSSLRVQIGIGYYHVGRPKTALRYFKLASSDYSGNMVANELSIPPSEEYWGHDRQMDSRRDRESEKSRKLLEFLRAKLNALSHKFFLKGEGAFERREFQLARALLMEALRMNPNHLDAYHRLALVLFAKDHLEGARRTWEKGFHRSHLLSEDACGAFRYERGSCKRSGVLRHKLEHDLEHLRYMSQLERNVYSNGGGREIIRKATELLPGYERAYEMLDNALKPVEKNGGTDAYEMIIDARFLNLLDSSIYKRDWFHPPTPKVGDSSFVAINPHLDVEKLEREYQDKQILYVDNILTPEALEYAFRVCTEGPYFHNVKPWGYLGAYLNDGFYHPVVLQIAKQLQLFMENIFKGHDLMQLWAYKYASHMEGIKMHGDDAAVNVNIWLTPDESNLDKNSGGLVVYRRFPDPSWDYRTFNHYTNEAKLEKEFKDDAVKIPYRANRAVIFNSHLWHKTDNFRFRKGFKDRRINLTLLFGRRSAARTSRPSAHS